VVGPLNVQEAVAGELVLEIERGLRVPAIVRGAAAGVRYLHQVSTDHAEGAAPLSTAGATLEPGPGGETHVTVPAQWPSRSAVGFLFQDAIHPGGEQVRFDPAAPRLPLVLEAPPILVRVAGAVAGVVADE